MRLPHNDICPRCFMVSEEPYDVQWLSDCEADLHFFCTGCEHDWHVIWRDGIVR